VSYLFSEDKVDVTGLVLADDGLLVVAGHVVPLDSCNIRKVKSRLSYLFREHFAPFHICSRNEFIGEGAEFHFASVHGTVGDEVRISLRGENHFKQKGTG
jgi:hypothetical protein